MRTLLRSLLPLALAALALAGAPRAALAQGRAPLRVTAADHGAAHTRLHDLLAQSRQAGLRLTDMPDTGDHARTNLGAPLPVAMIRLDRLQAYQLGAPLDDLIDHMDVALYPVQVDRDVRAEIELVRQGGEWQAVRVGAAVHAREVARIAKVTGAPAYLLRVPALGVELLAYGSGPGLRFLLVHATPGVALEAGRLLPAQDVLRVLVPAARAHDGRFGR